MRPSRAAPRQRTQRRKPKPLREAERRTPRCSREAVSPTLLYCPSPRAPSNSAAAARAAPTRAAHLRNTHGGDGGGRNGDRMTVTSHAATITLRRPAAVGAFPVRLAPQNGRRTAVPSCMPLTATAAAHDARVLLQLMRMRMRTPPRPCVRSMYSGAIAPASRIARFVSSTDHCLRRPTDDRRAAQHNAKQQLARASGREITEDG